MATPEIFPVNKMDKDRSGELSKKLEEVCCNIKESLRTAEEHFRVAVEDMGDWEYWIGQNNHYVFVSPACEKITGRKPEEFFADQNLLLKIIHPEDRDNWIQHIKEEQNSEEVTPLNLKIVNRNGEERFIVHKCRRVYDNAGNFLGVRATNHDLTDVKRIESEKQAFENRIHNYASTIEQIGKLAMESVNNFNNMVQKILGCVELLRMEFNKPFVNNGQIINQKQGFSLPSPAAQTENESNTVQHAGESDTDKEPYAEISCDYHGKILLIDDEEFILDMASDMLKVVNFDVITACSGEDAINLFRKHKDEITCVVLDFNMPDYDGKAVYGELRKIKESIPILISSGSSEQEVHLRCNELQTVPFLQKPYHFSTLIAEVSKLMPKRDCALV